MIADLPLTAWILLIMAPGLGLAIELVFYFTQRRRQAPPPSDSQQET